MFTGAFESCRNIPETGATVDVTDVHRPVFCVAFNLHGVTPLTVQFRVVVPSKVILEKPSFVNDRRIDRHEAYQCIVLYACVFVLFGI